MAVTAAFSEPATATNSLAAYAKKTIRCSAWQ